METDEGILAVKAARTSIEEKNRPTTDWNNPTAVVSEILSCWIPFLYTKVEMTSHASMTRLFLIAYGLSNPPPMM